MMMRRVVWLIVVAALAACARAGAGMPDSGIEGVVLIGPMCPVISSDRPCPDQPYQAEIAVLDARGREVLRIQSDPQGRFRAALPPGDYLLLPQAASGGLPRAAQQSVTIGAGKFVSVTLVYDSGIR